jgi:hypothetical protein
MARIWPAYEGKSANRVGPWADLPLQEAVSLFELRPPDKVSDLDVTPRFGDVNRDLWYLGYKHIVVEIGRSEAQRSSWRPGFYKSRVKPDEAFGRLLRHAVLPDLGRNTVIRVEHEPAIDSQGRDALRITLVIAPGAVRRLRGEATLNALVRLHERLREMGEERTPIVEYATEAELTQSDGP